MSTYYIVHDTQANYINVVDYEPGVPAGVNVYAINHNEKFAIDQGTHYFDLATKSVQAKSADQLQTETAAATLEKENAKRKEFLTSTDWKVLRHIRQQALGQPTSLTHQQYIELETARAEAASNII